jgi:hypothetical protein
MFSPSSHGLRRCEVAEGQKRRPTIEMPAVSFNTLGSPNLFRHQAVTGKIETESAPMTASYFAAILWEEMKGME